MDDVQAMKDWHEKEFLPWKAEAEKAAALQGEMDAKVRGNIGRVRAMIGMLMDGRTKQAVMAWNALGLQPVLKDVRVGEDGEVISLVTASGDVRVVRVEEVLAWVGNM